MLKLADASDLSKLPPLAPLASPHLPIYRAPEHQLPSPIGHGLPGSFLAARVRIIFRSPRGVAFPDGCRQRFVATLRFTLLSCLLLCPVNLQGNLIVSVASNEKYLQAAKQAANWLISIYSWYLITNTDGTGKFGEIRVADQNYAWNTSAKDESGSRLFPRGLYTITVKVYDFIGNVARESEVVEVKN